MRNRLTNALLIVLILVGAIDILDGIEGVTQGAFVGPRRVLLASGLCQTCIPQFVQSGTNNLFLGPGAGNTSATGINNVAFGNNSGAALTVQQGSPPQADTFIGYNAGTANTSGDANTFIGYLAGTANTIGRENTFIGQQAGAAYVGTGSFPDLGSNTFIGSYAGAATTANSNTFIGQKSGIGNVSGANNVYIGTHSGTNMVSSTNTIVGSQAGDQATTSGIRNDFFGYAAGQYVTGSAAQNAFIGSAAGQGSSGTNTTGSSNVAVGYQALQFISGGTLNFAGGVNAGQNATGNGNVYIGYQAGQNSDGGGNNTFVGYSAGQGVTGSRNTCIGTDACDTLPAASSNYFISGSQGSGGAERIDNVFFGKGYASTSPTAYTINGTGGSGSNIAGADVTIAGGKGTGTGTGGKVHLQVAPHGSSSSNLNSLVDGLIVDETQTVIHEKITDPGTAVGAGAFGLRVVAGTNAGSCKLIAYAGTSTTPVTIIDNVGSGC